MVTFLDLLIVVSMVLIAASLVAVLLMFLVKNKRFRQACLFITVALSLYMTYVGLRINWPDFMGQAVVALMAGSVSIGALVMSLVKKDSRKLFLAARIMAAGSLVIGVVNALLI